MHTQATSPQPVHCIPSLIPRSLFLVANRQTQVVSRNIEKPLSEKPTLIYNFTLPSQYIHGSSEFQNILLTRNSEL